LRHSDKKREETEAFSGPAIAGYTQHVQPGAEKLMLDVIITIALCVSAVISLVFIAISVIFYLYFSETSAFAREFMEGIEERLGRRLFISFETAWDMDRGRVVSVLMLGLIPIANLVYAGIVAKAVYESLVKNWNKDD
jgi:hypothetical protein